MTRPSKRVQEPPAVRRKRPLPSEFNEQSDGYDHEAGPIGNAAKRSCLKILPEDMSIAQLKRALYEHGVVLPRLFNRVMLLSLYQEQVLNRLPKPPAAPLMRIADESVRLFWHEKATEITALYAQKLPDLPTGRSIPTDDAAPPFDYKMATNDVISQYLRDQGVPVRSRETKASLFKTFEETILSPVWQAKRKAAVEKDGRQDDHTIDGPSDQTAASGALKGVISMQSSKYNAFTCPRLREMLQAFVTTNSSMRKSELIRLCEVHLSTSSTNGSKEAGVMVVSTGSGGVQENNTSSAAAASKSLLSHSEERPVVVAHADLIDLDFGPPQTSVALVPPNEPPADNECTPICPVSPITADQTSGTQEVQDSARSLEDEGDDEPFRDGTPDVQLDGPCSSDKPDSVASAPNSPEILANEARASHDANDCFRWTKDQSMQAGWSENRMPVDRSDQLISLLDDLVIGQGEIKKKLSQETHGLQNSINALKHKITALQSEHTQTNFEVQGIADLLSDLSASLENISYEDASSKPNDAKAKRKAKRSKPDLPQGGLLAASIRLHCAALLGLRKGQDFHPPATEGEKREWNRNPPPFSAHESDGGVEADTTDPTFPYRDGPGNEKATPTQLSVMRHMLLHHGIRRFRPDFTQSMSDPDNEFLWDVAVKVFVRLVECGEYRGITLEVYPPAVIRIELMTHARDSIKRRHREACRLTLAERVAIVESKKQNSRLQSLRRDRKSTAFSCTGLEALGLMLNSCCSDDEYDEEGNSSTIAGGSRRVACKVLGLEWRSTEFEEILIALDELRVTSMQAGPLKRAMPSGRIRKRTNPRNPSALAAPVGLWVDCYDAEWLKKQGPWEVAKLRIDPSPGLQKFRDILLA